MKLLLLAMLWACPVFGQPEITGILVGTKSTYLSFTTPQTNQAQYVIWHRPMAGTNWTVVVTYDQAGLLPNPIVKFNTQPPGLFRIQQVYRGP